MKILILVTDFKPPWDEGGKNNLRAVIAPMARRFDVQLLGLSDRDSDEVIEGVPVRFVRTPFLGRPLGRLFYPLACLALVRAAHRLYRTAPFDGIFSVLETASSCLVGQLIRYVCRADIPLVHSVWNDWYAMQPASPGIWITEHLPNLVLNNALLSRLALRRVDRILATSRYLVSRLAGLGFHDVPFTPTGVDVRVFAPRRPVAEGPLLRVGYLGHLTHAKGVSDLLEAIGPLLEPGKLELDMAVTGGEEEDWLERVDRRAVSVHGIVDAADFFNRCDVVVVPRRSSYGAVSYPNTLLEAMACGRAVLSTRLPGIDEIIEDGVDGFMVTPGSPVELRAKIQEMVQDPERLRRLGRAARLSMEERFSWDVVAGSLLSELERAFRSVPSGSRVRGGGVPS